MARKKAARPRNGLKGSWAGQYAVWNGHCSESRDPARNRYQLNSSRATAAPVKGILFGTCGGNGPEIRCNGAWTPSGGAPGMESLPKGRAFNES
jgi:hypothetical protein